MEKSKQEDTEIVCFIKNGWKNSQVYPVPQLKCLIKMMLNIEIQGFKYGDIFIF